LDKALLKNNSSYERLANAINVHDIVVSNEAPDLEFLRMIAPESEVYNTEISTKPVSKINGVPLPFTSFENKLKLFGYISSECGSPKGFLENMVKQSVADNKPYHQMLTENHKFITEKRKEQNEKKYRGLYAKNTFYPVVNR
jgi:hypothetical protein